MRFWFRNHDDEDDAILAHAIAAYLYDWRHPFQRDTPIGSPPYASPVWRPDGTLRFSRGPGKGFTRDIQNEWAPVERQHAEDLDRAQRERDARSVAWIAEHLG